MDLMDYVVPAKTRKKKAKNSSLKTVELNTSGEIATESPENAKDNSCSNGEIITPASAQKVIQTYVIVTFKILLHFYGICSMIFRTGLK